MLKKAIKRKHHYSEIEQEIIFLKAIQELIDEMVNYEIFSLVGQDSHSEIRFNSTTHQKFFNIILVDFLSPSDEKVMGKRQSYLKALQEISDNPHFNYNGSVRSLSLATREFINWLEQKVEVKIWLPSINREIMLSIKRVDFLKVCGNISKHNFSRLSGVANELQRILKENSINIAFEEVLLMQDDFYERFHYDILNYHGSTIAKFLNNIRWGIYEYFQLEFSKSIVKANGDSLTYKYTYPPSVNNDFCRNCYWELMNAVRCKPYVRKFKVTRWLNLRY